MRACRSRNAVSPALNRLRAGVSRACPWATAALAGATAQSGQGEAETSPIARKRASPSRWSSQGFGALTKCRTLGAIVRLEADKQEIAHEIVARRQRREVAATASR